MQVILQSGGVGSRLFPLTINKPKCFLNLNGEPIINYQYKNLISIDTGCVWGNELTSIKILKDGSIHKASIKC